MFFCLSSRGTCSHQWVSASNEIVLLSMERCFSQGYATQILPWSYRSCKLACLWNDVVLMLFTRVCHTKKFFKIKVKNILFKINNVSIKIAWICFIVDWKRVSNETDYDNLMNDCASKKSLKSEILDKKYYFRKKMLLIIFFTN